MWAHWSALLVWKKSSCIYFVKQSRYVKLLFSIHFKRAELNCAALVKIILYFSTLVRNPKPCVPIFQRGSLLSTPVHWSLKVEFWLIMELAEIKDPNSSFSKAFIEFVSGLCANECDRQNLLINSMEHSKRVAWITVPPRHLLRNRAVFKRNVVIKRTKSNSFTLNGGIVNEMFSNSKSFSGHSCFLPCLLHLGFINLYGTKTKELIVKMNFVARMGRESGKFSYAWVLLQAIAVCWYNDYSQIFFFQYFHLLVQSTRGLRRCSLALARNRLLKHPNNSKLVAKHIKQINNDQLCTTNEKNRLQNAEDNSDKVCSF